MTEIRTQYDMGWEAAVAEYKPKIEALTTEVTELKAKLQKECAYGADQWARAEQLSAENRDRHEIKPHI